MEISKEIFILAIQGKKEEIVERFDPIFREMYPWMYSE